MTYCAKCEQLAIQQNNPKLRSRLSGDKLRYRHKNVRCGCTNKSVSMEKYEADFGRLIKLLTIKPKLQEQAFELMTGLALCADKLHIPGDETHVDPEREKQEAISLCRKRIDAAINLYGDGRISREEYLRRVEQNERKITYWESRTSDSEKTGLELAMCMNALDKLVCLWDLGEPEERQGMARNLFSYIVYDLDKRRIVDFRLKPWADRFLTLRATLYPGEESFKLTSASTASGLELEAEDVLPEGFEPPTPGSEDLRSIP